MLQKIKTRAAVRRRYVKQCAELELFSGWFQALREGPRQCGALARFSPWFYSTRRMQPWLGVKSRRGRGAGAFCGVRELAFAGLASAAYLFRRGTSNRARLFEC